MRSFLTPIAALALATALAGCGGSGPLTPATCAVVQAQAGQIASAEPRYVLADSQSQPFCDVNLVIAHYEEAEAWFGEQTSGNRYGPELLDGLGTYYAEPLLHSTREMILYHQREGRTAVAATSGRSLTGHTWQEDGSSVTLTYEVEGYELLIYANSGAEVERFTSPLGRAYWLVTLVYAPDANRWKLFETRVEPPRV